MKEDELVAEINLNLDRAYEKLNPNNRDKVWNTALDISETIFNKKLRKVEEIDVLVAAIDIISIFAAAKASPTEVFFDQMRANRGDADNK